MILKNINNLEYLNKLLEEKNEDIKEIEYRKKCEIDDEMISQRKKTIRELLKFVLKSLVTPKGNFLICKDVKNVGIVQLRTSGCTL